MGNANDERNGWVWRLVPLETGLSDLKSFVKLLKQISFNGPISFHSEYQGPFSWRDLKEEEVTEQTKKDLNYFRSLFNS